MGPGHFGVAFAAKTLAPKAPLWTLLVASETLDLLSFGFMALGIEKNAVSRTDLGRGTQILAPAFVPWSHGLTMALVWSVAAGLVAWGFSRDRRLSGILALVVFSHWALDVIVHPGLPLFFDNSSQVGLGLWTSGPGLMASVLLDVGLCIAGLVIYFIWRRTRGSKV